MSTALVWFRRDLRLSDNPALAAALARHRHILPVYIHAPDEEGSWQPGAASRWWLHRALNDLAEQLAGRLLVRTGSSLAVLRELVHRTQATAVYWNRQFEPAAVSRDRAIETALRKDGVAVESHNGGLLFEPWEIANRQGRPFRVFTPFWKQIWGRGLPRPARSAPTETIVVRALQCEHIGRLGGVSIASLGLAPVMPWDEGLAATWNPSRMAAEARLDEFVAVDLPRYGGGRELPAVDQVSRLSAYLHFGQLGVRELVAACEPAAAEAEPFLRQLGWREFAQHLMFHFPDTGEQPMDERFRRFAWRDDAFELRAWQRGETGIPLVDAGMRQLWYCGWMHNRVRMVAGSFLTKNLLFSWQQGARWFWDTLVDADLANNSMGWQWVAGCGADAAPFFRVFNPVLQGERFDAAGRYVRRWVPELRQVPDTWIHRPWEAPAKVLSGSSVVLGADYPWPLVDLKATRQRALAEWQRVRSG